MNYTDDVNADRRTTVAITLALLTIIGLCLITLARMGNYSCNTTAVVVEPGDTLHSIAVANCDGDWRAVVHDIAHDAEVLDILIQQKFNCSTAHMRCPP